LQHHSKCCLSWSFWTSIGASLFLLLLLLLYLLFIFFI
jgi:hypothetical protein